MATIALLAVLAGAAYYSMTYDPGTAATVEEATYSDPVYNDGKIKDFLTSGIVLGSIRSNNLALSDLNEAYKPFSAPDQTPASGFGQVARSFARNLGYEETYAPAFFFSNMYQIPLTTSSQSDPNIMQLTAWAQNKGVSSLEYFPRAYYDYENKDLYDSTITSRFTTMNVNTEGGMPTETEGWDVLPDAGQINHAFNPWGPGGKLQMFFNSQLAQRTNQKGADLASIVGPPKYD